MKKGALLFVVGLLFCIACNAQKEAPLIPRDAFFTGEQRFAFKLSPQADKVYFQTDKSTSVFYCPVDSAMLIREIKITPNSWEPVENGLLACFADSLVRLSIVPVDGKETPVKLPFEARRIRILTAYHQQVFALEMVGADDKDSGIYRFDLARSSFQKIAGLQTGKTVFFDKNMNMVAAHQENDQGGNSLYWYDKPKAAWKPFVAVGFSEDMFLGGFTKIVSVAADGKTVYFTTNLYTDKSQFYAFHPENNKIDTLAAQPLVDILPFGVSTNTEGRVTSVVGLYAKTMRVVTDPAVIGDFGFLTKNIPGDISYGGHSVDGSKWLIREFTGGPAKYYLYDRSQKQLRFLLTDYPALDQYPKAARRAFFVPTRDGLTLPVHVYLPPGSDANGDGLPDKPLPTILYVHGGPWAGVTFWNQYFHWRNFQLLANRGYAVINCEFRGSTGLGKDFIDKSSKVWGTDMVNDKVDIANWARSIGIAPVIGKIGIWGWSYGGYAAMAGLAFSPETYDCGIAMYGISDLEAFLKTDFANNDFWHARVGNLPEDAAMLRSYSPINFIDRIQAPLLLTTGSKDDRVPQSQMDHMADAMKKAGKDVTYFYYPEEEHDYRSNESWVSFWAIAEGFLAKHLGGRSQPGEKDRQRGNYVVKYE